VSCAEAEACQNQENQIAGESLFNDFGVGYVVFLVLVGMSRFPVTITDLVFLGPLAVRSRSGRRGGYGDCSPGWLTFGVMRQLMTIPPKSSSHLYLWWLQLAVACLCLARLCGPLIGDIGSKLTACRKKPQICQHSGRLLADLDAVLFLMIGFGIRHRI
jgi:hypothetical protein